MDITELPSVCRLGFQPGIIDPQLFTALAQVASIGGLAIEAAIIVFATYPQEHISD
jgi:hypothetical protein